jgi:quercetin dioxygenase-like cupin family protein
MYFAALVSLAVLTLVPQAPYASRAADASYRVDWETDQVRVAHVTLAPGQSLNTPAPNGRVVIFLGADLDGRLPSSDAAWVENAAFTNRGSSRFEAIVIDVKGSPSGSAGGAPVEAVPAAYDRYSYWSAQRPRILSVVDNQSVTVTRARYPANTYMSAFHVHPRDEVVVYLTGGYTWPPVSYLGADRVRRGDVRVIPANTLHTLSNAGADPLDFIVVSLH